MTAKDELVYAKFRDVAPMVYRLEGGKYYLVENWRTMTSMAFDLDIEPEHWGQRIDDAYAKFMNAVSS